MIRRALEATHALPGDVRSWLIERVLDSMEASELREERDTMLREAASLMAGAPWTKARRICGLAAELSRCHGRPDPGERVRCLVAGAMELSCGRIPSVHTVYRAIACTPA